MNEVILGILAGLMAMGGWFFRDIFAQRTQEKLTKERDEARLDAEETKIIERARANETAVLRDLQKKNAAIDALDGDDLLDELNARNKLR